MYSLDMQRGLFLFWFEGGCAFMLHLFLAGANINYYMRFSPQHLSEDQNRHSSGASARALTLSQSNHSCITSVTLFHDMRSARW